jgi:hypothetical protein
MRYTIDKKNSVKASFNRNLQYVHLASFSSPSACPPIRGSPAEKT